jgi:hypothetical protein
LVGVREHDPCRNCDELNGAFFHPAVSASGEGVGGRDVFPGQGFELVSREP